MWKPSKPGTNDFVLCSEVSITARLCLFLSQTTIYVLFHAIVSFAKLKVRIICRAEARLLRVFTEMDVCSRFVEIFGCKLTLMPCMHDYLVGVANCLLCWGNLLLRKLKRDQLSVCYTE